MRSAVLAALMLGACAAQDGAASRGDPDSLFKPDAFTVAGNLCGASDYAHLVGEPFAETHQAALPANARVIGGNAANTLEYAPRRINVILDGEGRIAAIGCF